MQGEQGGGESLAEGEAGQGEERVETEGQPGDEEQAYRGMLLCKACCSTYPNVAPFKGTLT